MVQNFTRHKIQKLTETNTPIKLTVRIVHFRKVNISAAVNPIGDSNKHDIKTDACRNETTEISKCRCDPYVILNRGG